MDVYALPLVVDLIILKCLLKKPHHSLDLVNKKHVILIDDFFWFRFVSVVSRFGSFRFCFILFRFVSVSFLVLQSPE